MRLNLQPLHRAHFVTCAATLIEMIRRKRAHPYSRLCRSDTKHLHPPVVVLELEWVLRSRFGFIKSKVVSTLSRLLPAVELWFGSEAAVEVALALYQRSATDFSYGAHVALRHGACQTPFRKFDKPAAI